MLLETKREFKFFCEFIISCEECKDLIYEMADEVLQELSRFTIKITKCEEAAVSWQESCLAVLAEKGLHIYELSHNVQCFDKRINCVQSIIGHPKTSPTSSLFTNRVINKDMKNIHLNEMVIDHALWPHNSQLMQEMSTIVEFKWSPVGLYNQGSLIAVLTNVGVVEIYKKTILDWKCALEISTQLRLETGNCEDIPRTFTVLKDAVYSLATTAVCWSPTLNEDKSCYFVTAQKDGYIILWLIQDIQSNITAKFLGSFDTGTSEIMSIVWIPLQNDQFLLVCSNILGQVIIYKCESQNEVFRLVDSYVTWAYRDRMIANQMQYLVMGDKIGLIFNKHRHLVILMLKEDCTIIGQYVKNINDYRIVCISKSSDGIHIATVNYRIYKLNLTMVDADLEMKLSLVDCQPLSPTYELYSISHSTNNTIFTLSTVDRNVTGKKGQIKLEILLMSTKEKLNSLLSVLLENPTKQLTQYWDVIEVLRYRTMKTKEPPKVDYNQIYETACVDAYMLKLYLIFCTLCDSLKRLCKLTPEFCLPEDSINIVKEDILVAHADKTIQKYSKKYQDDNYLNDYDMECFLGAKKFLEFFFNKSQRNLCEVMDLEILNIVNRNVFYTCQFCDEHVTGFTCNNEHMNMFCSLTFTPINEMKYLVCKWCNLTVRKELLGDNPLCLFCEDPLMMNE